MRCRPTLYGAVCAFLVVLLALVVVLNGLGSVHTDIKPEIYLNPWGSFLRYIEPWISSPYLGYPNFNVGLAPVPLVLAPLQAVGLGPEAIFKVFHLALWLLAAVGTSRLLRALVPGAGQWAGLAAGVAYLVNPYAVTGGSTLAILLPMSLLPWQLLCLVRGLQDPRSWRWPILFGLTFFAMSGMNAAVIPLFQLLAVIPVVLVFRHAGIVTWREILVVLARCAAFVLGVSIYWLVPAVAALSTGVQVIAASEAFDTIGQVSSFPEVLRGVGMWVLYGRGPQGPWIPEFAGYLTLWPVILITLCYPALALLCLRWIDPLLVRLTAVTVPAAALIMVGLFPGADPASPAGAFLGWLFENVPALAAFRTTNKIGAVLYLFLAMALGAGLSVVVPRLLRVPALGAATVPLALMMAFVLVLPAVTGRLYTSPFDIPAYWRQAAAKVDARPDGTAVLFLPGQVRSHYRWSLDRPDDLSNSIIARPVIIPETIANTSEPGANLLAALDGVFQSGAQAGGAVSTLARYLGVGEVLLRHDTAWEEPNGARPATTAAMARRDPGLVLVDQFGRPGENTASPYYPPESPAESKLPPLELFAVQDAVPSTRVSSTANTVVVVGDGWGVAQAGTAGLLGGAPLFRYAADLSAAELAQNLGPEHRIVLTDTNARRNVIPNQLVAGQGALLPAYATLDLTRTLWDDPADQTVLETSGVTVSATTQGGVFFDVPYGSPANAVDGDPSSSWLFGDFGHAVGASLTMTLPSPTPIGEVKVTQTPYGSVRIDEVTLTAAGRSVTARLSDDSPVSLDLGGVEASQVTLTVRSLRGTGFNMVGIAEVDLGHGLRTERVARVPTTLTDRYAQLDTRERALLERTPLDILFTRVLNSRDVADDTERTLDRDFALPGPRELDATAAVRILGARGPVLDRLDGYSDTVRVDASGTWFDLADHRPSRAADSNPDTGWQPGGPIVGSWLEIATAHRSLDHVVVDQAASAQDPGSATQWATAVDITVDGKPVASHALRRGRTAIPLPAGTAGTTVRLTFTAANGPSGAAPAIFPTIDTGVTMRRVAASACVEVATLDGKPLFMRPVGDGPLSGPTTPGTSWTACGPLALASGAHALRSVSGVQLDSLTLRDRQAGHTSSIPPPAARVVSSTATSRTIEVGAAKGPYAVILGEGWNPQWRASADGRDLGTPVVLDGYSSGWIVTSEQPTTIDIVYGPRTATRVALGVTMTVILISFLVLLVAWRRRGPGRAGGHRSRHGGLLLTARARPPVDRSGRAGRHQAMTLLPALGVIAVGGLTLGWVGLVAGCLMVGLGHARLLDPQREVSLGAALVLLSGVVYVTLNRAELGQVDATVVYASMWPHWLAGCGLLFACVGGWRSTQQPPDAPDHPPEQS